MIIYAGKDYQDVSRKAANIMSAQIIMKPDAVLGLATGSTPVGMYAQLVEWYKKGDLDFSRVTSVNLDEYKGLSGDNDQSYRYFMDHNLFDHVNIDKARTFVPDGLEEDSDKACAQYNEIIRQTGGVDMQLLGIGGNRPTLWESGISWLQKRSFLWQREHPRQKPCIIPCTDRSHRRFRHLSCSFTRISRLWQMKMH